MSLLAKGLSIRKLLKPGWILFIPVFFGCETSDDQGIKYDLDQNTSVKFREFSLPITNFYRDSLLTSGEQRILVGSYADPLTGTSTAEGYFQYFYNSGPVPNDSLTIDTLTFPLKYDSIELILRADDFILDPTSIDSLQSFSIQELASNLIDGGDYLSSLRQSTEDVIGLYSRKTNKERDSIYTIKISDTFGEALFERLASIPLGEEVNLRNEVFTNLALVPEDESEGISLINLVSADTRMLLHMSADTSALDSAFQVEFAMTSQSYSYLERSSLGTAFESSQESADFDFPDGQGVLDPLMGIFPAYSVAALSDFFEENENIIINSAVISFDILQEDPGNRDLLSQFYSFFRKADGSIYGPATQTDTYRNLMLTDNGYLTGALTPATVLFSEDSTRLLLLSTLFTQSLLREYTASGQLGIPTPASQSERLIDELVPVSFADVTLNRLIIPSEGIVLRIYYTEVN